MDTRNQHGNQVGGQTDACGKPTHGTTDDFSSNPQTAQHHGVPLQQAHHTAVDGGAQRGHQAQMMRPTTEETQGGTPLKEKIKEKLPGGHKTTTGEHGQAQGGPGTAATGGCGTTPTAAGTPHPLTAAEEHEKKGMMEKIKEKLPGGARQ